MEGNDIRDGRTPILLKFIIGPAHRVRPLAGPLAGSGAEPGGSIGATQAATSFAPVTNPASQVT